MKYVYLMLNWAFGVLFILTGMVSLVESPVGGLCLLVIGGLLFPPVRNLVYEVTNIRLAGKIRAVFVVTLFLVYGVLGVPATGAGYRPILADNVVQAGILFLVVVVAIAFWFLFLKRRRQPDVSFLPEQFVIFDLETTGLKPDIHEIIEIGAIRVTRDSENHDTFQALVRPKKKVSKKITEITGITREMLEEEGEPLDAVLPDFIEFIGDLPLVSFNAEFDMAFLAVAVEKIRPGAPVENSVSCALKMARRAWPGLRSYSLTDLAKSGGLSVVDAHRALGDCRCTMAVYAAASVKLKSAS